MVDARLDTLGVPAPELIGNAVCRALVRIAGQGAVSSCSTTSMRSCSTSTARLARAHGTRDRGRAGAFWLWVGRSASRRWTIDRLDGLIHTKASRSAADYRAWRWRRRRRYLEELGVDAADMPRVLRAIGAWESEAVLSIFDDVHDVAAWLTTAGIKLGICSNWDWELDCLLHAAASTICSTRSCGPRARRRKPHRRIYACALRELDVTRDRALFVGDSWLADVRRSCPVRRSKRSPEPVRRTLRGSGCASMHPVLARAEPILTGDRNPDVGET